MAQRTRLLGFLLGVALAGLAGWVSAARQRRKPLPLKRIRDLGGESRRSPHGG